MSKRLYRSKENSVIAGVCGGIAEYMDIDPTIVRLAWVIFALCFGSGILAYIVCIFVIPERPAYHLNDTDKATVDVTVQNDSADYPDDRYRDNDNGRRSRNLAGILLICLGGVLLARRWLYWIDFSRYWPVILIVIGIYIIVGGRRGIKE
jgi:phage shock protein C